MMRQHKFTQRAPKDSKIPEARFVSEDEDTSDTSAINCTTDDEEEMGYSAKQKKQHPANPRKSSKTAESVAMKVRRTRSLQKRR